MTAPGQCGGEGDMILKVEGLGRSIWFSLWCFLSCCMLINVICEEEGKESSTVLITGGAGFIGRHFAHKFCRLGWEVTIVDNLHNDDALHPLQWSEHLKCSPELLQFINNEYLDYFRETNDRIVNFNESQRWTVFLHLATTLDKKKSDVTFTESVLLGVKENFAVDIAAIDWLTAFPNSRTFSNVIFLHSTAPEFFFFPSSPGLKISHMLSKQSGRHIIPSLHQSYGINVVQYEVEYVYGDDQDSSSAMKRIARLAKEKYDPIIIEQDFNMGFLHVTDLVNCVLNSYTKFVDGTLWSLLPPVRKSNMTSIARMIADKADYSPSIIVNSFLEDYNIPPFPAGRHAFCAMEENIDETVEELTKQVRQNATTDEMTHHKVEKLENVQEAEPIYSSFKCSGGNQDFHDMKPYDEDSISLKNKVCKLENICFQTDRFVYFQHPEESMAPEFVQIQRKNIVKLGLVQDVVVDFDFYLSIARSIAVPSHLEFDDNKTWFLILSSYSDGIGHHLMDDLYPVLSAMDLFEIPLDDAAIAYTGCRVLDHYNEKNAYNTSKNRSEVCDENFATFSKLIFDTEAVMLPKVMTSDRPYKCFKSLVVGQNYAFNVDTVDKMRAITMRKGRDLVTRHITNSIEAKDMWDFIGGKFVVLILPKNNPGFQAGVLWPTICKDVPSILQKLGLQDVMVICNPSGTLKRDVEISLINQASLIIAEHGTLSLLAAFYGRDGAVLISVGKDEEVKNTETLLYSLHIHVLFTTIERMDNMTSLLRYGLHLAARNHHRKLTYIDPADSVEPG